MKNIEMINNAVEQASGKTRKPRRRFAAAISAVFAAAVMVTGIAVFSASASPISDAPEKANRTAVTAEVKTASESLENSNETDFIYGSNEQESQVPQMRMLGFNFEAVKANAQLDEQHTAEGHHSEPGEDHVNQYGKHPGEMGYGYTDAE